MFRCHRLGKDCQPAVSVRRRQGEKGSGTKKHESIEESDCIFSASLSRPAEPQPEATAKDIRSPLEPHLGEFSSDSSSRASNNVVIDTTTGFARFQSPDPGDISVNRTKISTIASYVSLYDIPDAIAEEQLGLFRRIFLPLFAFVHIPTNLKASDLRSQKPFLWLIIMSITTKSADQQTIMGDTIRRIVSQQVLAEQEKSLDLLLGLICYIGWFVLGECVFYTY